MKGGELSFGDIRTSASESCCNFEIKVPCIDEITDTPSLVVYPKNVLGVQLPSQLRGEFLFLLTGSSGSL